MKKNKNKPKISIIIVNWNGKKWLKECIDSLKYQDYEDAEIILVDNDSSDESIEFLENRYASDVKIIKNKNNFGFGKANNIGVENSRGDILFFLNNDTRFPSDLISSMVEFKNDSELNIVGPRVLDDSGVDLLHGIYIGMDFMGYPGGPTKKMFYIDGCSLMISKEDFLKLGKFDEEYFMYGEDVDLCWRARLAGMKMGICENVKLTHYGGGSSEKTNNSRNHVVPVWRRYEVDKNTVRSILKNYKIFNLLWILPIVVMQNLSESLLYFVTGSFEASKASPRALLWNVKNLGSTWAVRKDIQEQRVIGDIDIFRDATFYPNKLKAFSRVGIPIFK